MARSTEEMIDYYEELAGEFPILSIEDPLDEEDWGGWELLTTRLGLDMQLVGDDLFVTNVKRLNAGILKEDRKCNSDQSQSDRDTDRSGRCDSDGAKSRLSGNRITPFRRDGRSVYCRSGGGIQYGTDQNRCTVQI